MTHTLTLDTVFRQLPEGTFEGAVKIDGHIHILPKLFESEDEVRAALDKIQAAFFEASDLVLPMSLGSKGRN